MRLTSRGHHGEVVAEPDPAAFGQGGRGVVGQAEGVVTAPRAWIAAAGHGVGQTPLLAATPQDGWRPVPGEALPAQQSDAWFGPCDVTASPTPERRQTAARPSARRGSGVDRLSAG
jgi:hypothetical protein